MNSRFLIFFSVVILLMFYTGVRIVGIFPHHHTSAVLFCVLFFSLLLSWPFAHRFGIPPDHSLFFKPYAWSANIGLGVWATFLFLSLSFDIGRGLYFIGTRVFSVGALPPYFTDIFLRWIPASLLGVSVVLAILGWREMASGPVINHIKIPIAGLSPSLNGMTIVQISDLHVGATIGNNYVQRIVDQVMAFAPDLIALTGDLADGAVDILSKDLEPLAKLKAPLGKYFVTGNHEYYWDVDAWVNKTRELGFTPLLNENRVAPFRGGNILVGGVTDTTGESFDPAHKSDPRKAAATTEQVEVKILLAHRPDSYKEAEPAGFDLQLSGHTHGGQFFPWSLIISFFHTYARGLHRHGRLWIYVNVGTGYWGPPHRFAVPSEITVLTLIPQ
jgi:uncharacterized protein